MKKPRELMIRMQEELDIPAQATGLEPITTVTGRREVAVDGQRGLLSLSDTEVSIAVADGAVVVSGGNLRIVLMKQSRIVVRGDVETVSLQRGAAE